MLDINLIVAWIVSFFGTIGEIYNSITNHEQVVYHSGNLYKITRTPKFVLKHELAQVLLDEDKNIIGKCEDKDLVYYSEVMR